MVSLSEQKSNLQQARQQLSSQRQTVSQRLSEAQRAREQLAEQQERLGSQRVLRSESGIEGLRQRQIAGRRIGTQQGRVREALGQLRPVEQKVESRLGAVETGLGTISAFEEAKRAFESGNPFAKLGLEGQALDFFEDFQFSQSAAKQRRNQAISEAIGNVEAEIGQSLPADVRRDIAQQLSQRQDRVSVDTAMSIPQQGLSRNIDFDIPEVRMMSFDPQQLDGQTQQSRISTDVLGRSGQPQFQIPDLQTFGGVRLDQQPRPSLVEEIRDAPNAPAQVRAAIGGGFQRGVETIERTIGEPFINPVLESISKRGGITGRIASLGLTQVSPETTRAIGTDLFFAPALAPGGIQRTLAGLRGRQIAGQIANPEINVIGSVTDDLGEFGARSLIDGREIRTATRARFVRDQQGDVIGSLGDELTFSRGDIQAFVPEQQVLRSETGTIPQRGLGDVRQVQGFGNGQLRGQVLDQLEDLTAFQQRGFSTPRQQAGISERGLRQISDLPADVQSQVLTGVTGSPRETLGRQFGDETLSGVLPSDTRNIVGFAAGRPRLRVGRGRAGVRFDPNIRGFVRVAGREGAETGARSGARSIQLQRQLGESLPLGQIRSQIQRQAQREFAPTLQRLRQVAGRSQLDRAILGTASTQLGIQQARPTTQTTTPMTRQLQQEQPQDQNIFFDVGTTTLDSPQTSTDVGTVGATGSSLASSQDTATTQSDLTRTRTLTDTETVPRTRTRTLEVPITRTAQTPRSRTRSALRPQLRSRATRTTTTPGTPRPPRGGIPPGLLSDRVRKLLDDIPSPAGNVQAQVKREGRWLDLNGPTTTRAARKKGTLYTRETLGASFRLKDVNTGNFILPRKIPRGYRTSKNNPFTFVERRRNRLDNPVEVRQIQRAKKKTSRRSKK